MVGIGTAIADDPLLTTRNSHSQRDPRMQPVRIVVDSTLRLPLSSRLVATSGAAPLIVACAQTADESREEALRNAGADIVRIPEQGGKPDFAILLAELGARGVTGILLEGGGELAFSAMSAGCVNQVVYFIAPMLLGGRNSHTPLDGAGFASPASAVPLHSMTVRRCGRDWVVCGFPR